MVGEEEPVDDALDDAEVDEDNGGVDMAVREQAGDVVKLGASTVTSAHFLFPK